MTGTDQNFNSEQWHRHVEAHRAAVKRVTPPPSNRTTNNGQKK